MIVRVNTASIAADANQIGLAASKLQSATTSAASALRGCAGMAGIDPMAEDWVLGPKEDGGYDQSAESMLKAGITLAQAVAGFEGYLISLASGYRAIELAGATGGANQFLSLSPTAISASPPSIGSALGDEQLGSPQGEIMEWIENFLKDTAGIVIPTANTGKVRSAASAWDTYQSSLLAAGASVSAALPATLAAEFPQRKDVQGVQTKLVSLIDALASDAGSQSTGCGKYADSVDEVRGELLSTMGQLALEVAIDIGVGVALSFFTFGAGALAAAGKAAMTIAKWVPRLLALVNRLKALIMTARRTMAVMRRAAIEAIEATVSGTVANAGASLAFQKFSWEELGGSALSSGIGGAIAGPFSNIGSNIASRGGRITTRSAVDGVTGGVGGVAGEWASSQMTGQEFNLVMAALVGTAGGAAGGGLTSIKSPSVRVSTPTTSAGGRGGTQTAPNGPSGGSSSGGPSAGSSAGGSNSAPAAAGAGGAGAAAAGGGGGAVSGGASGAPSGGAPAGGSGSSAAPAGGSSTPNGQVDVPASLAPDAPAGGSSSGGSSSGSSAGSSAGSTPTPDAGANPTDMNTGGTPAADGPAHSGPATDTPNSGGTPADGPAANGPAADGPASTAPQGDATLTGGPSSDAPAVGGPAVDGPGSANHSNADGSAHAPVAGTGNTGVTATGGIPSGHIDLPASLGPDGPGAGSHADGPSSTSDGGSNSHRDGTDAAAGHSDAPNNNGDAASGDTPAQGDADASRGSSDDGSGSDAPSRGDSDGVNDGANSPGKDGDAGNDGSDAPVGTHNPAALAPIRPELDAILNSKEMHGPGWQRVDDSPPTTGGQSDNSANPNPKPGLLGGDYGPRVDIDGHATNPGNAALLLDVDPTAPYGYKPDGTRYTDGADWSRDHVAAVHGQTYGRMIWASNDGAVVGTRVRFTELNAFRSAAGNLHIDRLGSLETGSYMGIGGGTFNERALPPSQVEQGQFSHITLRDDAVLPEGWSFEVSRITPAYGQRGGGLQLLVVDQHGNGVKIEELIRSEIFDVQGHKFQ